MNCEIPLRWLGLKTYLSILVRALSCFLILVAIAVFGTNKPKKLILAAIIINIGVSGYFGIKRVALG